MAPVLVKNLSKAAVDAARREGRLYAGKVYQRKSDVPRGGSKKSGSRGRGPLIKMVPVNSSAAFWADHPGPRETLVHSAVAKKTPRELVGYKAARTCYSTADTAQGLTAWAPALPIPGELVGLQVRIECDVLPRDVVVQAAFLLANNVEDVDALDWDIVKGHKDTLLLAEVRSTLEVHKIRVSRPVNSGASCANSVIVMMTRAVDSATPSDAKIKFTIEASVAQPKAGSSSVDL